MKKLVLICFLSIVSMLTCLTFAQTQQGFWLQNADPSIDEDLRFSLNLPVHGQSDAYYIKVDTSCLDLGPCDTAFSLAWEIWRNGVLLGDDISNYADFKIQPYFTDFAEDSCRTCPRLFGQGWLNTNNLASGTGHFPGAVCHGGNDEKGYLVLGPQGYNYFYLHYLIYASNNNYLKLNINWDQVGDYKIVMKLVKRTGGTKIENYYNHVDGQNLYYGGHCADSCCVVAEYVLEPMYRPEHSVVVCGGETIQYGIPALTFTATNPTWPIVDTLGPFDVPFHSDHCFNDFVCDSIVKLTLIVNPIPPVPTVENVNICGTDSATLVVANPLPNVQYAWHTDVNQASVHVGESFTAYNFNNDDSTYTYYIIAFSGDDCKAEPVAATVTTHPFPVVTLPTIAPVFPMNQLVDVTAAIEVGTFTAPVQYTWTNAQGDSETAQVQINDTCGKYPYAVAVVDSWGCAGAAQNFVTVADTEDPVITANVDANVYGCGAAALPAVFTTIADVINAGYTITDNSTASNTYFTQYFEVAFDSVRTVDDCNYKVVRSYTIIDRCGNSTPFTHTITVVDSVKPSYTAIAKPVVLQPDSNCTFVLPANFTDTLISLAQISDNCTAVEDLTFAYTYNNNVVTLGKTDLNAGIVEVTVTDACHNSTVINLPIVRPTPLTIELTAPYAVCAFDSYQVVENVYGGTAPYSFERDTVKDYTTSPYVDSTYTYVVMVEDALGCDVLEETSVLYYAFPKATISSSEEICFGETGFVAVAPTSAGNHSFAWEGLLETTARVDVTPATTTVYTVTVTNDSTECSIILKDTIVVHALPTFTPSTTPQTSCVEENGTLTFDVSENAILSINGNRTKIFEYNGLAADAQYVVFAIDTITNCESAPQTITIPDGRELPTLSVLVDNDEFCINLVGDTIPVQFTATTNTTNAAYTLTINGAPVDMNAANLTYKITAPGHYTYVVTVEDTISKCSSVAVTGTIYANPIPANPTLTTNLAANPSCHIEANQSCGNKEITLFAEAFVPFGHINSYAFGTYTTEFALTNVILPSPTSQEVVTYNVVMTTDQGCTASADVDVTVFPLPIVTSLTHDTDCPFELNTITATVAGGTAPYAYSWINGVGNALTITIPNAGCGVLNEVTFKVTDYHGCVATRIDSIFTVDTIAPVFTSFPEDTLINCDNLVALDDMKPTYMDNCTSNDELVVVFNEERAAGDCINNYVLNRIWTITDKCGNSVVDTQKVRVQDIQGPEFAGNFPNVTIDCIASYPGDVNNPPVIATDNCSDPVTYTFKDTVVEPFSYSPRNVIQYVYRYWTAFDACDNPSATKLEFITVVDTIKPIITRTPDFAVTCADFEAAVATLQATAEDVNVCDGAITPITVSSVDAIKDSTCTGGYKFVRTWFATDNYGNTAIDSTVITVNDNVAPVFVATPTFNATIAISCEDTIPSIDATAPSFEDNCGIISVNCTPSSTQVADQSVASYYNYTITRKYVAVDDCGNASDTVVVTINVADNDLPTAVAATVPANITLSCEDAIPTLDSNAVAFVDNCANGYLTTSAKQVSTQVADQDVAGYYNYTITRTWTAVDPAGNVGTAVQVITVQDVTAPVAVDTTVPAAATYNCHEISAIPALDVNAVAFVDNCANGHLTITANQESTQVADQNNVAHYNYTITRTWTAVDPAGNVGPAVQIITVQDVTAPVVDATTVPADITLNCDDDIPAAATVIFTDNCSPVTVIFDADTTQDADVRSAAHYNYTITRTWVGKDVAGNTSDTVRQVIIVQDVTAPIADAATIPADVTVSCDNIPVADNTTVTFTDNCFTVTPADVVYNQDSTQNADESNIAHYNYTITRTWTATDAAGNTSIPVVQTITVQDVTAPTFTVPADVTICKNADGTYADLITPALVGNVSNLDDNCAPANVLDVDYEDDVTNVGTATTDGTIIRTWKVTDVAGNVATATQTITLNHIPVVAIAGSNGICFNGTEVLAATADGATAAAFVWSTGETTANITIDEEGTYTVTATVNGCSSSATIVVEQYEIPTLTSTVPEIVCEGDPVEIIATATDAQGNGVVGDWYFTSNIAGAINTMVPAVSTANTTSNPVLSNATFFVRFVDAAHNCNYYDTTAVVRVSSEPFIVTYLEDANGNKYEADSVEINAGDVLTYYVRVFQCALANDTRTAIDFDFNKFDGSDYVQISNLNQYLNTVNNRVLYNISHEGTNFGTTQGYLNSRAASTIPYADANSNAATAYTPNGGTNYFNWFYIHYFNRRFIEITINRFQVEGDYKVDYQLFTRMNGANPAGTEVSGVVYTPGSLVGGYNFNMNNSTKELLGDEKNFYIKVNPSSNPTQPTPDMPSHIDVTNASVSVYPNPAVGDNVKLAFNNIEGKTIVRLISLNGKVINEMNYDVKSTKNEYLLNLNNSAPGAYFIQIINGDTILSKKLIIKE